MKNPPTRCIVDVPTQNADLLYACRFDAPDPILFIEHRGKKMLFLSDLELDRGRRQSCVHAVRSLATYSRNAATHDRPAGLAGVILEFCAEEKIRALLMPASSGAGLVDTLRTAGLTIATQPNPFYTARLFKRADEIEQMRNAQRAVFRAMQFAHDCLRAARIGRDGLLYRGKYVLTSEWLRAEMSSLLMHAGYSVPSSIIVACGKDALEPHNDGFGKLRAHTSIIVDIFPRSITNFYYGDATRTFCRGTATPALRKLYAAVKAGQQRALDMIRHGVDGRKVHEAIHREFTQRGYTTGEKNGTRQGFIHGTGHGLGLDLHEEPVRINQRSYTLKTGHVVTVEPGLYYEDIGGVRIEDAVVVTKSGCEILGKYPRKLEL